MSEMIQWGTPHRLADDDKSLTTRGGVLQLTENPAILTAGNRTFVLHRNQKVLTKQGFQRVSDLSVGESSVAFAKNNPLAFGGLDIPNTLFLLGVMAGSYDPSYQAIASTHFDDAKRQSILEAIPLAVEELDLKPEGSLYPRFVKVSTTDNGVRWVLTSSLLERLSSRCNELGIHNLDELLVPLVNNVSRNSALAWLRGLSFYSQDELRNLPTYIEDSLRYLTEKFNLPVDSVFPNQDIIDRFEATPYPLHVDEGDWYTVEKVENTNNQKTSLFQFDLDNWVYPLFDSIENGGIVCSSL